MVKSMTVPKIKNLSSIVLALLFVVSLAGNAFLAKELRGVKADPQKQAAADVRKLVSEVGTFIVLPEGEDPTVATVTDPAKLKDQPFFARASAGDKVLIYTNAKKAILYSPTSHKVVEVAPLNIGQNGATATAPVTNQAPAATPATN